MGDVQLQACDLSFRTGAIKGKFNMNAIKVVVVPVWFGKLQKNAMRVMANKSCPVILRPNLVKA